jgi:hypothetical protein
MASNLKLTIYLENPDTGETRIIAGDTIVNAFLDATVDTPWSHSQYFDDFLTVKSLYGSAKTTYQFTFELPPGHTLTVNDVQLKP